MEKRDASDNLQALDNAADATTSGYFVYLVECEDKSLYAGITTDLARRMAEHRSGGPTAARYTRLKGAKALVAAWSAPDRSTAGKLEYRLKRLSHRRKAGLAARPDAVSDLWAVETCDCPWLPVSSDEIDRAWRAHLTSEELR